MNNEHFRSAIARMTEQAMLDVNFNREKDIVTAFTRAYHQWLKDEGLNPSWRLTHKAANKKNRSPAIPHPYASRIISRGPTGW